MKPIVIYGSGRSLLKITEKQWEELRNYDSLGFNWFILQDWIKLTYIVIGDTRPVKNIGIDCSKYKSGYDRYIKEANRGIYDKTKYFCAKTHSEIVKYMNRKVEVFDPPHNDWNVSATMHSLYIAIKLGYKDIVFAGVDLYDNRYFYIDKNEPRIVSGGNKQKWFHRKVKDKHPIHKKIFRVFDSHPDWFEKVNMFSYNPKSLLLENRVVKKW